MAKKTGLGRGLESLFIENNEETKAEQGTLQHLRIAMIEPKVGQPRKTFDENALAQLATSIATYGVLQPILVRPLPADRYQIIAGERRYRAAKMAGLDEIPAIVVTDDAFLAAQMALVENIQREDLNPVEEAAAYRDLSEQYGMTQEELAQKLGKSRSAIANSMRLLDLPEEVLSLLEAGNLSAGQARTLLGCRNLAELIRLAHRAADGGMTVRELESAVRRANRPAKEAPAPTVTVDYAQDLSTRIMHVLGRRVVVNDKAPKKCISIYYTDNDDLEGLLTQICGADFFDEL